MKVCSFCMMFCNCSLVHWEADAIPSLHFTKYIHFSCKDGVPSLSVPSYCLAYHTYAFQCCATSFTMVITQHIVSVLWTPLQSQAAFLSLPSSPSHGPTFYISKRKPAVVRAESERFGSVVCLFITL